jgi:hypothetical protein
MNTRTAAAPLLNQPPPADSRAVAAPQPERIYSFNLFFGFDDEHCEDSLSCRVRYCVDYGTARTRWKGEEPVLRVIAVEQQQRHFGGETYWSAIDLPDAMHEKLISKIEQEEVL